MSQLSKNTINSIKKTIKTTRVQSMLRLNKDAVDMYFKIGKELAENIDSNDGSQNIVKEASRSLIDEFGKGQGYSERSLKYCVLFYREADVDPQVHQAGALIPWKHLIEIISRVKESKERTVCLN